MNKKTIKTDGKNKKKLTLRQQKFCDEYLLTGNATQSAINAGYSEKTAYSIGNENLKKPEIKAYISENREKFVEKVNESIDEIKLLASSEVVEIKDNLFRILRSDLPVYKYVKHFRYDKKTKRKQNHWAEESEEDNRQLKVKTIEGLLKLQTVVLQTKEKLETLKPKVENINLKNKEIENKVNIFESEMSEGHLDNVTGVEIIYEHQEDENN